MVTETEEIFHPCFGEKSNENKLLLTSKISLTIPHCNNSPLKEGVLITLKYSDLLQAEYLNVFFNK